MSDAPSRPAPTVHAFVLCWPRWEAAAHHVAEALNGHVDHLTVLYKNDTGVDESGPGEWRRIPSERFYGWQFSETLRLNAGDVMLHVQADASHGDWPWLVARCREAFRSDPDLGVWSPNVYHSWYVPRRVQVGEPKGDGAAAVTVTDGVVWALSKEVTDGMARLDYADNNIGWGLTETAAAVAATRGRFAAMDLALAVKHPKGSGYNRRRAIQELRLFQRQLTQPQRSYLRMCYDVHKLRDYQLAITPLRLGFWRQALRRLAGAGRQADDAPPMLGAYGR